MTNACFVAKMKAKVLPYEVLTSQLSATAIQLQVQIIGKMCHNQTPNTSSSSQNNSHTL